MTDTPISEAAVEAVAKALLKFFTLDETDSKDIARDLLTAAASVSVGEGVSPLIVALMARLKAVGEVDDDHVISIQTSAGDVRRAAALLEQAGGGGWRDIKSAPKDGTYLLVWAQNPSGQTKMAVSYFMMGGWQWLGAYFEPIYWQPLPAPPEGDEK